MLSPADWHLPAGILKVQSQILASPLPIHVFSKYTGVFSSPSVEISSVSLKVKLLSKNLKSAEVQV